MSRAARILSVVAWALATCALSVARVWSADNAPRDFLDLKSADQIRYDAESRTVHAQGNVRFGYSDVEAEADALKADLRVNRAVLTGAVTLRARGEEFHGAINLFPSEPYRKVMEK